MEKRKAMLVILHHNGDARILRSIEGSDYHYMPSANESTASVVITQASTETLKKELSFIGLKIDDVPTIEKVARKFSLELAKSMGGKLAWDDRFGLGLCEIIEGY